MVTEQHRSVRPGEANAAGGRTILAPMLIVMAAALGLALAWINAANLLLLFAGILFAVFVDACVRGLSRFVPATRAWRFALVGLVLGIVAALAIMWGLARLPEQARSLVRVMDTQIEILESRIAPYGIDLFGAEGRGGLTRLIGDPGQLFGHVHQAVSGAYAVAINTIVIVVIGLFFAANPGSYRDGALSLLPIARRPRVRDVMDEMGQTLRYWLLGQLVRNITLAVMVGVALNFLGLPGASLLGLQAGVANFIPYLGPLVAAGPVALVAMPLGVPTLIWAIVLYFSIQTVEGFVFAPLIQRGAVDIPPVWTLLAIVIFGAMFGAMGIALATPLLAIGRIAVLRLYIEDCLGDRPDRR